jgi:hypothetical protein
VAPLLRTMKTTAHAAVPIPTRAQMHIQPGIVPRPGVYVCPIWQRSKHHPLPHPYPDGVTPYVAPLLRAMKTTAHAAGPIPTRAQMHIQPGIAARPGV